MCPKSFFFFFFFFTKDTVYLFHVEIYLHIKGLEQGSSK